MPVLVSTTTMIKRLSGLLGTNDINAWEANFVESLSRHLDAGQVTRLTDAQVETLDSLHSKHFA